LLKFIGDALVTKMGNRFSELQHTFRQSRRATRDARTRVFLAHRDICCGCTSAVGIGGKRSPTVYEYSA